MRILYMYEEQHRRRAAKKHVIIEARAENPARNFVTLNVLCTLVWK